MDLLWMLIVDLVEEIFAPCKDNDIVAFADNVFGNG